MISGSFHFFLSHAAATYLHNINLFILAGHSSAISLHKAAFPSCVIQRQVSTQQFLQFFSPAGSFEWTIWNIVKDENKAVEVTGM